jgi:Domain of unknown function (DUF4276)
MPLRIQVIVEGQGDENAISRLLARIWQELGGDYLEPLRPFRQPQGILRKEAGLSRAVNAAWLQLGYRASPETRKVLLLLMDSEGDCPAQLAPKLLGWARKAREDADIICVLAHHMFETWFAACASSLAGHNDLPADLTTPDDPEGHGLGKGWLRKQLPRKYQEPTDQPKFVSKMNVALCRANSPSFDKLCRELAQRLPAPPASEAGGEGPEQGGGAQPGSEEQPA